MHKHVDVCPNVHMHTEVRRYINYVKFHMQLCVCVYMLYLNI